MSECKSGCYKWLVIIILLVNTFFIGSIWCSLKCKTNVCPLGKVMSGSKMCPLNKGSMTDKVVVPAAVPAVQ